MSVKNTEKEYGSISKVFHWTVLLLVIVMLAIASQSTELPRGQEKLELILLHASFGLLLLFVLSARLLWRWLNITPAKMPHIPVWQHVISRTVHYGLYIMLFVQIFNGMARFATAGYKVPFFGLFEVGFPMDKDEALNELIGDLHGIFPIVILVLLGIHILAALYHHFWLKDNTLRRMTTGIGTGR